MDFQKLHQILTDSNRPAFREKQIRHAFWQELQNDWDAIAVLPKELKEQLKTKVNWSSLRLDQIVKNQKANLQKARFILRDQEKIESVLIKHADGRRTVCVSSQVGCPMRCDFCATGKIGFKRNLNYEEIVDQVLFWARLLKVNKKKITNIVYMGMGEPFLNYDNVLKSIKMLNDKEALNLGARHISISTVGIPAGIRKLAKEKLQVNLAFSLHAPINELRSKIIPANQEHDLAENLEAIDYYIQKTNRRVMIEYLMIEEVNDNEGLARKLSELLSERPLCYVNLISYNQTGKFKPSSINRIKGFAEILKINNIKFTIRHKFGDSVDGACGQLAGKG